MFGLITFHKSPLSGYLHNGNSRYLTIGDWFTHVPLKSGVRWEPKYHRIVVLMSVNYCRDTDYLYKSTIFLTAYKSYNNNQKAPAKQSSSHQSVENEECARLFVCNLDEAVAR